MTFSVWISHAIKLGRRLRASTVPGRADVRRDTGALVDPRSAADAIVAGEVETLAALVARGRSNRAGAIAFGHHATLLQHVLAEAPRHWPLLQRPRSGGGQLSRVQVQGSGQLTPKQRRRARQPASASGGGSNPPPGGSSKGFDPKNKDADES